MRNTAASVCLTLAVMLFGAAGALGAENIKKTGIVVMHGKRGAPTRLVLALSNALEARGYLVASLEMPWSRNRGYNADVNTAEAEVSNALKKMRKNGARKLFVAGHSQGALFTAFYAGRETIDGLILIAPGGNVASEFWRRKIGDYVEKAEELIAGNRGEEPAEFMDYEGSRGVSPVITTARIYLSWFSPSGAMNQYESMRNIKEDIPVLHIAPADDYKGLRRVMREMHGLLPNNSLTELYQPDAGHKNAPTASIKKIIEWTEKISAR